MINFFDPASDKSSDLGTPARESEVQVSLSIDGRAISVPAGTSVMRAAAMLGTSIPKLCATDSLEAFGSCRMCMVEIEGMRGYPASCTTPVSEGKAGAPVSYADVVEPVQKAVVSVYSSKIVAQRAAPNPLLRQFFPDLPDQVRERKEEAWQVFLARLRSEASIVINDPAVAAVSALVMALASARPLRGRPVLARSSANERWPAQETALP